MDLKVSNTDDGSAGRQHLFQTNRTVATAGRAGTRTRAESHYLYSEILADCLLRRFAIPLTAAEQRLPACLQTEPRRNAAERSAKSEKRMRKRSGARIQVWSQAICPSGSLRL